MAKVARGFTLIETIVTIGILAVGFSLTGVAVSQLVRVQDSASGVAHREDTFQSVDSLLGEYVSYVSVDTPVLNFELDHWSSIGVVFTGKQYDTPGGTLLASVSYSVAYSSEESKLEITKNVISGEPVGYLDKSDWRTVKGISSFSFTLDETIHFLTADVGVEENTSRCFCYVLRTLA